MLQHQFKDISIFFYVLGFTSPLVRMHPQTIYNVAVQSRGKTLYGINHKGTNSNWNDAFGIKLSSFKQDEVYFAIFVNDIELGKTKLDLLEIYQSVYFQNRKEFLLTYQDNNTGYIDIKIIKSPSLEVVGGLPIPRLSFRPDHIQNTRNLVPIPQHRESIQKPTQENLNLKTKIKTGNFFSCLDDNTKQLQVIPNHIQVRNTKSNYYSPK